MKNNIGLCPDCERENVELITGGAYKGICTKCRIRKINAKCRGKEYIPYKNLSVQQKAKSDHISIGQNKKKEENNKKEELTIELKAPDSENYYQAKATQAPVSVHSMITEKPKKALDPLSDQSTFIKILKEYRCEIPEENLKNILDVLLATNKLKDIFMTVTNKDNQEAIFNLEQALNAIEKKLQYNWEYNGFQEIDDIKFKGFLVWKRVLKEAIFFWKKLYQTNTLNEMQKVWEAYTSGPNEKQLLVEDEINTTQKKFQVTTESISTIFNTKRPFTRVFFATDKDDAYKKFTKWMEDHQLHENKSKTIITELNSEGSTDERKEG